MALRYFAYIYLSPEFDRKNHTVDVRSESSRFKAVGLDFKNKAEVIEVAQELVREGAQLIELCGGFGPLWIAKVSEAIKGAVPVGSVAYGPEARQPLLDILAPGS